MTQDVKSRLLPGGSLLSAYLDRQLMIWSDRGGASHHIGDRWAAHCSRWLDGVIDTSWPVVDAPPVTVSDIIRLDDIAEVSREANHYHLENPDFLIVGHRPESDGKALILAVDAKFAADRIKPSQVSAQVVENLISIPETRVTRSLVEKVLESRGFSGYDIVDGAFMCPESILTDFLLNRRYRGRTPQNGQAEIIRIEPDPGSMFSEVSVSRLIPLLARQDRLPVTPRENLLSAIYYFRVASACVYLWQEQHLPLFTIREPQPPELGVISADLTQRATEGKSAYRLMLELLDEAELVQRARQAVANVASLPLRMTEIRAMVQENGGGNEKNVLRLLRRDLELEFRSKLFDRVGEISASDPRPLGQILDELGAASRDLRPHMHAFAQTRLQELSGDVPSDRAG